MSFDKKKQKYVLMFPPSPPRPGLTGEESIELILEFAAPALVGNFCHCCQLSLYSTHKYTYTQIYKYIIVQIHK